MRLALGVATLTVVQFLLLIPDVIPTRPGRDRRAQRERVAKDLAVQGLAPAEGATQIRELSASDLDYFATDSRRTRLAAGIPIEDILIGVIILAVAATLAIIAAYQASR